MADKKKKREPAFSVAVDRLMAKRREAYEVLDLLHHLLHTNERIVFERVAELFEPDRRDASSEPAERELPFRVEVSTYLRKRDEVDGEPAEVESGTFCTIAEALRRTLEVHKDRDRERLKRHAAALRRTRRDEPKGAYTFPSPSDTNTSSSPSLSGLTGAVACYPLPYDVPVTIATSKAKPLKKPRRRSSTKA